MAWYEALTKPMDVVAKAAVTTEDMIKERVTRAWQDITDRLFYDLKCQRTGESILFNNVRVPLGETEKLVSGVEYETYRVEVTPKQAVRMGELEFEAWREDRYNIKITQGDVTIENEALRQKIIQQLRHFPHFLTNPQFKSRDSITDIDETARHWYTLWLIEHNSIYRVNQTRGLLPPHYTREDLKHDVMGLAIEKNDPSIVENYYGKVNYALEIQKQLLVEKQRVLKEMIAESEAAKREARKQFWKKVGWVVLGLVIVAAVLVGLYFLSPIVFGMAIGALGLGNILSFFKGAALGILEVLKAIPFLNLLFIGLLAITAVGVYRSYSRHKENLITIKAEETEEEIKKIEKAQNALEFEKAMIISKVTGIRDKIAGLSETEGVLNLSGYMLGGPEVSGMIGIIQEHASEITELNLSDNKIDAMTLKTLVEILKTQSVLCVLDLRGNVIEQCNGKPNDQGIRAFHTMLRSNFTITELKYDAQCFADNQPLKDKIVDQINMNRYLHGEGFIGEKGREEIIRQKALSKLQYNFYITSLTGHIREEMQEGVRKICVRNRVLQSLRHSSSETTLAEFVSVYHSSPEACDRFLQLDWSYSKSVKKRLQTLLTTSENSKEAIFALHSLERKSLQGLIQSIQGRVMNEQNRELLFGILQVQAHFPEEGVSSLSNRSYQSLLGTLQMETLAYLKGESNFDAFLKKTVQWRVQLEKLQDLGGYKSRESSLNCVNSKT